MPCYRLFYRHPDTGHFVDSEILGECDDDRAALMQLADHVRDGEVELWERDRLVAIVKSTRKAA
jgi:hypothetical protein